MGWVLLEPNYWLLVIRESLTANCELLIPNPEFPQIE